MSSLKRICLSAEDMLDIEGFESLVKSPVGSRERPSNDDFKLLTDSLNLTPRTALCQDAGYPDFSIIVHPYPFVEFHDRLAKGTQIKNKPIRS
jgi:hypothetical protein